jgi:hypothetical protein
LARGRRQNGAECAGVLKKLGTLTRDDAFLSDEVSNTHRDMYCTAIRAFHAQGKMART